MEKKGQKRNKKNDLERKVEKLQLTADDRETRGFISMICTSPSAGLTAICTLEPPHSTPISRMMATEASRRRWYSCGWLCVGGSEEFVFFQREKERAGELFELFFFLFSFSFHPFHFPLSLSLLTLSVSVCAGATVIESPVCTPMGSRFSIEQMITTLSARSCF